MPTTTSFASQRVSVGWPGLFTVVQVCGAVRKSVAVDFDPGEFQDFGSGVNFDRSQFLALNPELEERRESIVSLELQLKSLQPHICELESNTDISWDSTAASDVQPLSCSWPSTPSSDRVSPSSSFFFQFNSISFFTSTTRFNTIHKKQ